MLNTNAVAYRSAADGGLDKRLLCATACLLKGCAMKWTPGSTGRGCHHSRQVRCGVHPCSAFFHCCGVGNSAVGAMSLLQSSAPAAVADAAAAQIASFTSTTCHSRRLHKFAPCQHTKYLEEL